MIRHLLHRLFHRHAVIAALAIGLCATSAQACNQATVALFTPSVAVANVGVYQQSAFVSQAFVPSVAVVQAFPSVAVQSFFVPSVAVVSPFVDVRVRQRAFVGHHHSVVRQRTVIRN